MISLITLLLYPLAIQCERKGVYSILLPLYIVTALLDVLANYTELSLLCLAWPQRGKPTFSMRIPQLLISGGWKSTVSYEVAVYLNFFSPTHDHITEIL